MQGFNYIYKTSSEVLENVPHLSLMGFTDMLLLIICLGVMGFFTFFLTPYIIIIIEYRAEKKSKLAKKKLLTQILLQKEIEDEVEKEVEIEDESSLT